MINIKKFLILSAIVATVVGAYVVKTQGAYAQNTGNPHESLIQKIAEKFGLSTDDVEKVFDEHHQEMQAKMQEQIEKRLSQLVSEGKITEAQKELIIKKHEELKAEKESLMEAWKDKTPEERKALMDEHRKELETWAEENGIDLQYFHFGRVGMGGHFWKAI